jgi:hypothetical protein
MPAAAHGRSVRSAERRRVLCALRRFARAIGRRGGRLRIRCSLRRSVSEVLGRHLHAESLAEREQVAALPAMAKREGHCESLRVSLRSDAIKLADELDEQIVGPDVLEQETQQRSRALAE